MGFSLGDIGDVFSNPLSLLTGTTDLGGLGLMGAGGLLGGGDIYAASEANKAQRDAYNQAVLMEQQGREQAREDINRLFPQAQQRGQQGYQSALDIFKQVAPQQTSAFQGGNVAAQNMLLAGLPMAQSAILGGQIDYSALQPYQAPTPDFSFLESASVTPRSRGGNPFGGSNINVTAPAGFGSGGMGFFASLPSTNLFAEATGLGTPTNAAEQFNVLSEMQTMLNPGQEAPGSLLELAANSGWGV